MLTTTVADWIGQCGAGERHRLPRPDGRRRFLMVLLPVAREAAQISPEPLPRSRNCFTALTSIHANSVSEAAAAVPGESVCRR